MTRRRAPICCLLLLLALASCSDSTGPELIPPLLYLPASPILDVDFGDPLRFEVRTTAAEPYPVEFTITGDTTVTAAVLEWRVNRVGEISVVATARKGNSSRTHTWTLRAGVTGLDPLGPVRLFEVTRRPEEGSLRVAWLVPRGEFGDPTVDHYELALSLQPISSSGFEEKIEYLIDHRRGVDAYQQVFSGLQPGVPHYFRVRAVDVLDRKGTLSAECSANPPQLFSLSGQVLALGQDYDQATALGEVRLRAQSMDVLTTGDGRYEFASLLDYLPFTIEVQAPAGSPLYYPITREIIELDNPLHDYVLLPQSEVEMLLPTPDTWDFLLLLRTLTNQLSDYTQVSHWESYPVEVEVPERTLPSGIDYATAMRRGIAKWNAAMGFEVLRESATEPSVGVLTRYELVPQGGGILGKVSLVEPVGGTLFTTVPRKLSLDLLNWYASQELIDRVILHELGHVLYLAHSPASDHLMSAGVSQSSPNEVHPDEVSVLRALVNTPNGTLYSWYEQTR